MTLDRVAAPTRAEFERRWVRPGQPVIIEGAIEDWPARKLWSAEYLARKFGERVVRVAQTRDGRMPHHPSVGYAYDELRLDDYLQRRNGYSIFAIGEALPELALDLGTPGFLPESRWTLRKLWLSPTDTRAPLHQDLPENFYAQVVGRKKVTLFSPGETKKLYRQPLLSKLPNFSRVDPEAPDHSRFPRFREAQPITLVLEPGDVLYVPRLWWHQMRSLEFSISVSHWWATGAVYWAVRAGLLYQKLRALRY